MPFSTLGLSDALARAVADEGYTVPTPIQAQAIPLVLAGGDLLAGAQTGTGKTAGFVLPILQRLSTTASPYKTGARKPLRTLILTPTRELAAQVEASIRVYGKHLKITSMVLFGGVSLGPQTTQLKRGVDILVATPGRLLDHHGQGNVDFSRIEIFVLDEADRMLDMGFIPDVKRVLALLPKKRQNLLFSATFSDEIKALADKLLDRPRTIQVEPRNSTVEAILQRVHPVDRDRKRELLSWLIKHHDWRQVLVFTRTKHGADKLARALEADGIDATALHGNKSQNARTRALAGFKNGDGAGAGGDRHRGARHRHRPAAARGQLRPAQRAGRLRAPHRPHRSRRQRGRGDLAGVHRRARVPARYRAPDQARNPGDGDSRIRARSARCRAAGVREAAAARARAWPAFRARSPAKCRQSRRCRIRA